MNCLQKTYIFLKICSCEIEYAVTHLYLKIEKNIKNLSRNQEDRNNSSEDVNNEEIQKTNKSLDTTTIAFIEPNVTTDSTIPSLSVLGK